MDLGVLHDELLERIVEADDDLMERYLNGEVPTEEELRAAAPKPSCEGP